MSSKLEQVTSNFKTFTTNQGENTLEKHLNIKLNRDKIIYCDILVGYFNMNGFNKISQSLKNNITTRILVGINTENKIFKATKLIDSVLDYIVEDLQEEINNEKDENVKLLLQ